MQTEIFESKGHKMNYWFSTSWEKNRCLYIDKLIYKLYIYEGRENKQIWPNINNWLIWVKDIGNFFVPVLQIFYNFGNTSQKSVLKMINHEVYFLSLLNFLKWHQNSNNKDFLGGPVVENLPANAGDAGSIPGLGRFHMPWGNWAHAPRLLTPVCLEPMFHKSSHCSEKPTHCNQRAAAACGN